jgi:hypothetical protein
MNRLHLLAGLALAACSSTPADIAGDYSVAVTNETNGCNFASYVVGNQSTGVTVTITQTGGSATAAVTGLGVFALDAVLGGHTFTGTVDGDAVNLSLQGTATMMTGNCAYTYNGAIIATADGDALMGKLTYTGATNNNSDCGSIQGCVTYQDFSGTRPPQ